MMEDVFQTINWVTEMKEKTNAYSEPNFKPVP